jgi:DNA-binding Xre family transcriptional regulator
VLSLKLTYKKLWKLMIDKEINRKTLARMANISASTLTKLSKGDCVNTDMLVRICIALKCDLHDIVELVPDEASDGSAAGAES